ncbi:hypothetical protein ABXN37_12865 [Piscinibacter sakaiensis]|uniref:Secreted protein n=1 Tax=Piscinibacter sakaiensis TaxID=1547922 RepID=A0A0K8P058_PISS1|nr:hypothetical protein [Piscinibacter sakaiensis]GAP36037.1 hypothetical protein ISF6_1877 [Piscinibacter sakaiensis]
MPNRRPLPRPALAPLAIGLLLATAGAAARAEAVEASPTLLAATADRSASGCPALRLNHLQRRVLVAADRGEDGLRRYVQRTRMIHQLDLAETDRWVQQVRARNADCRVAITALAP